MNNSSFKQILDKVPDIIDFNFITAKNIAQKSFILENPTNKNIYFKIQHKEDNIFSVSPFEGILHKNQNVEIKISVIPQEAEVLVSNIKLNLDETATKIIKISFISKYPYLKISRNNLDFGNVLIGKSKEMELILKNTEKVPLKFVINRLSHSNKVFHLKTSSGEIPENCSYLLKITYIPQHPDIFSYETFNIKVNGGNEIKFNCYGKCNLISSSISSRQVNFESVEQGRSAGKVIRVFNESEVETSFQFFYSNEGIFSFVPKQGIIKSRSNERISVYFNPRENMSYYDRAFCLFKNHIIVVSFLYKAS